LFTPSVVTERRRVSFRVAATFSFSHLVLFFLFSLLSLLLPLAAKKEQRHKAAAAKSKMAS
jgi:hypothetical protein